jgi:hypothetical protein
MNANLMLCNKMRIIAVLNNQGVTTYMSSRISIIPNTMTRFANNVSNTAVYQ